MKANTSRENNLAFNNFPERYNQGRPVFDQSLIARLLDQMEIAENSQALEIGPATGQLTAALLQNNLHVTAVEPGPQLASYLQSQPWATEKLQVVCSTFEQFDGSLSYSAIFAANSFHWVDPTIGYQKAYNLLHPNGALYLMWTFPILANQDLQQQLNEEVFVNEVADFRRQPDQHIDLVQDLMTQGRTELMANSPFEQPAQHELITSQLSWSSDQYIDFQRSQANGDLISDTVADQIRAIFADKGDIVIDNHIAITMARKQ